MKGTAGRRGCGGVGIDVEGLGRGTKRKRQVQGQGQGDDWKGTRVVGNLTLRYT